MGMTPAELRIEAIVIAVRPVLITLPLTVVSVAFMITASYLDPMEFLTEIPFVPMIIFILAIFGFVALAYFCGAKRVNKSSLIDTLRNDALT